MDKKKIALLSVVFLFVWVSNLIAQSLPSSHSPLSEIQQKAIIGREMIFHRRYGEAVDYFKKLEQEYPESPLGSFGQMAIWQARMFENYDFKFWAEFNIPSNTNQRIVKQILADPQASAWDLFLAGASAGLRGFSLMRNDQAFKALSEANTARKALNRAREQDPSFADVDLGFGMYDFWRSVFTNRLKFLPFFKDKRQEGLAQVERAAHEGKVAGPLAELSLAFCYHHENNFNKGIPLLQRLLKHYPENVIAKNLLGGFYASKGDFLKAHEIFDELLKNNPEITIARFLKASTFFRENRLIEARKWYEDFLSTQPSKAWASYALTDLGRIDLKENKEAAAYKKFKEAYHLYSENTLPLKELKKLRDKEGRW